MLIVTLAAATRRISLHNITATLLAGTALIAPLAAGAPVHAADATWIGGSSEWTDPGSWSGSIVPNGTATFTNTGLANVANDNGSVAIGAIVFGSAPNAQSYSINVTNFFAINNAGVSNNSTNMQTFNISDSMLFQNTATASSGSMAVTYTNSSGSVNLIDASTLGSAIFTNNGLLQLNNFSTAGSSVVSNNVVLSFFDSASALSATINNSVNGIITFGNTSTAASSTINNSGSVTFSNGATAGAATINNSATVNFNDASTGGTARLIGTTGNSVFDISGLTSTGMTAGSIEGSGAVRLGSKALTVGGSNLVSTFGGVISDGGASGGTGGSLVKTGTGTLTLTGNNTYTGDTTISAGTLALSGNGGIASSRTVIANGTFDISGASVPFVGIQALTGSGAVTLGSNGLFLFAATGEFSGHIDGAGGLEVGTGTQTLSGANTYTNLTQIDAGATLALRGSGTIASSAGVSFAGAGTFDISRTTAGASIQSLASPFAGATVNLGAQTLTITSGSVFAGVIADGGIAGGVGGSVTIAGGATQALSGVSTYTGATTIAVGGELDLTGAGSIAASNGVATNGILDLSATTSGASIRSLSGAGTGVVSLGSSALTISNGAGSFAGIIQDGGNNGGIGGSLTVAGGQQVLTGANTYTGGTTITGGGTIIANNGGNPNSSLGTGDVTLNNGTLKTDQGFLVGGGSIGNNLIVAAGGGAFEASTNTLLLGNISGAGQLTFRNTGALNSNVTRLAGDNSGFTGTTIVASGLLAAASANGLAPNSAFQVASGATLDLAGIQSTIGSLSDVAGAGGVVQNFHPTDNRTLTTGGDNSSTTFSGVIQNGGPATLGLVKTGTGTFTLSGANTYTGPTTVSGGNLRVNGAIQGDVTVQSGGTLSGIGSVGGAVVVQSGGTLSAGQSPGTITLGSLNLNAGSTSQFELGAPGVVGGTSNDLVNVTGNLTLGGTLNVNAPSAGYYRLFNYGTLTTSSFAAITGSSQGTPTVLTNIPNQVNLSVLAAGQRLQFWDGTDTTGNGVVNGGAGTWNATSTNWTGAPGQAGVNDQWRSSVGVFAGAAAGTVTVVGTQAFDTLQFSTSGYVLNPGAGGQLQLAAVGGATATINTDGGVTATINTPIVNGSSQALTKVGGGTLVITAANTYTGGTTISAGTLQLGNSGTTGSIVGNVTDNGTLTFNRSNSYTFDGVISGTGAVQQIGTGMTILTAANTFTGGTTISAGTLQIGNGGTTGSIVGNVTDNGTLAFNRSNALIFGSAISGTGAVNQIGSGTTTLTAANTYTGATTVGAGTLAVAAGGSITSNVSNNATFTNAGTASGRLTNSGTASNSGTLGSLSNSGGTFGNTGTVSGASTVSGGAVTNAGAFQTTLGLTGGSFMNTAGGSVAGTTTNAGGTLTNTGGTFAAVVNTSGTFNNNTGTAGAVSNAATATNGGTIASLTNSGGTLSNSGTISGGASVTGGLLTTTGTIANGVTVVNGLFRQTAGSVSGGLVNNAIVDAQNGAINGAIVNNAGTFNAGGGGGTLTGDSSFTNAVGATLALPAGGTYTIAGLLTNSGSISVVSGAALNATAGGITNTATGTITNAGTIRDDLNNAGAVTNNGIYVANVATNSGTIVNNATWTGNVVGSTGTLTNAMIWNGSITTSGAFTNTGTVSGLLTSSAGTAVNNGVLNGGAAISGGVFSGSGSVTNLTVTGGTFAPGTATPGTSMTVSGNLALASGVQYLVQLNPTTASFTTVGGTATLGGAGVNAVYANGSYINKRYTLVTATGGLSGTFGTLVNTNLPTNFSSNLSYDAANAYLDLTLNFAAPAASGLNQNQRNVASTLVNVFNTTGGIPGAFGALSAAGLTQISGEGAVGTQQATFDAMNLFLGLLTDPFVSGRGDSASVSAVPFADEGADLSYMPAGKRRATAAERDAYAAIYRKASPLSADQFGQRWSIWAAGYGGSQRTDGNALLGSNTATSSVYGTAVGIDYRLTPNTLAGIALAGGGTNWSVANGLGSGRSDLFQAGAFVRHTVGPTYITAALAYGWQDVTTDRTVTVAGIDRLNARFRTDAFSGRVEGGYRYAAPFFGGMGLTPYAAGQFTTYSLPGYAETVAGGANTFALNYAAKDVTASRSEFGLRTDKSFGVQDGVFTLRGRAAWAHNFNPDRSINATFQTLPGASFTVNGASQAADAALVTASAEMKWRNNWSAAATFEGEFSGVTRSYAGKGVVRYAW